MKAIFVKKFGQNPPFTHNLNILIEKCEINADKGLFKKLSEINEFNLSTRYPNEKIPLYTLNEYAVRLYYALLEKKIKADAIILYGSYANGNPHKDSDIDFAVIS